MFVQASETSTGVYHDIEALAKVVKKYENTILIVDAISAIVAHDLRMDEWGIDVMIGGSQRALCFRRGLHS